LYDKLSTLNAFRIAEGYCFKNKPSFHMRMLEEATFSTNHANRNKKSTSLTDIFVSSLTVFHKLCRQKTRYTHKIW